MAQSTFKRNAHKGYFRRCLQALPARAQEHDSNRITLVFFCLAGLTLLGELNPTDAERDEWIEWIWSLQAPTGGFRGSPFMTTPNPATSPGHLPSTYTALCSLALLRAPLDRLDRPGLRRFLRACQAPDGSFAAYPGAEGEFQNDVRMAYCAAVTRAVLVGQGEGEPKAGIQETEGSFDVPAAISFLRRCKTWEGGYSSRPGIEAQGGTTYCATAALTLLGAPSSPADAADTTRWLAQRQIGGFQGRPGKLEDVCYSFWCGGALATLHHAPLVNAPANTSFLLNAQSPIGGFGKAPDDFPDPFHSYLALAALALTPARDELGLAEIDPVWNLPFAAREWLRAGAEGGARSQGAGKGAESR